MLLIMVALIISWEHNFIIVIFLLQAKRLFVYVESIYTLPLSKIDFLKELRVKAVCNEKEKTKAKEMRK